MLRLICSLLLIVAGALSAFVALTGCNNPKSTSAGEDAAGLARVVQEKKEAFETRYEMWTQTPAEPNSRKQCTDTIVAQEMLCKAASEYRAVIERQEALAGPDAGNSARLGYLRYIQSSEKDSIADLKNLAELYDRLDTGDVSAKPLIDIAKNQVATVRRQDKNERIKLRFLLKPGSQP